MFYDHIASNWQYGRYLFPTWLTFTLDTPRDDELNDNSPRAVFLDRVLDVSINYLIGFLLIGVIVVRGITLAVVHHTRRPCSQAPPDNRSRYSSQYFESHGLYVPNSASASVVVRLLKQGWALSGMYSRIISSFIRLPGNKKAETSQNVAEQQEALLAKNRQKLQDYHELARVSDDAPMQGLPSLPNVLGVGHLASAAGPSSLHVLKYPHSASH